MAKKYFKPEFLNRVDDCIVFRKLERPDLMNIVKLETEAAVQRLRECNIKLICSDDVLNYLLDKGFEPEYGARPLRRAVERYLEDPLSEELLKGNLTGSSVINAELVNDTLQFVPLPEAPVKKKRTPRRKKSEE